MDRKRFLELSGMGMASISIPAFIGCNNSANPFFSISLAEWSLHRSIYGGEIDHLEFPEIAKNKLGIAAVEYVNQFFADKANDKSYLDEMNSRCSDLGVDQLLIMVDGEGAMAVTDDKERNKAVENHYKWVEAAQYLGCHSIRVNTFGDGTPESQKRAAVDSLGQLSEFARDYSINVIVENHGGYSSNGKWLADVMQQVDMDNCGTLPDFGNFCLKNGDQGCIEEYDRYKGVKELMPYAKGVSAKSYAFDNAGKETTIDFEKMLSIVKQAKYSGHIGVEYEGSGLSEIEGIRATKKLLLSASKELD